MQLTLSTLVVPGVVGWRKNMAQRYRDQSRRSDIVHQSMVRKPDQIEVMNTDARRPPGAGGDALTVTNRAQLNSTNAQVVELYAKFARAGVPLRGRPRQNTKTGC